IGYPFPYIPGHVVCTIWALPTLIISNGRSIAIAIIGCTVFPFVLTVRITKICQPTVKLVPPRIDPPIRATRRSFPSCLCVQAFPGPGAISFRVLVADVSDRMLLQPRNATAWTTRRTPVGTIDLLGLFPRENISPALALGMCAVACRLHKLPEVVVSHFVLVDVEGVQIHAVPWDFIPEALPPSLQAVKLVRIAPHADLPG